MSWCLISARPKMRDVLYAPARVCRLSLTDKTCELDAAQIRCDTMRCDAMQVLLREIRGAA